MKNFLLILSILFLSGCGLVGIEDGQNCKKHELVPVIKK